MAPTQKLESRRPVASGKLGQVDLSAMDRRVEHKRFTRGRLMTAALVVAAVALFVGVYASFGLNRSVSIPRERLVLSTVQEATFREYIPVTGTVVPRETTFLDLVEGGQVAEVLVEEGAHVEAGQPLAKLRNANLELEVITRETHLTDQLKQLSGTELSFEQTRLGHERELIEVQFQIDQVSQRLERQRKLFSSGIVSQADVDDMEAELARSRRLRDAVTDARAVNATLQRTQLDQLHSAVEGMKKNLGIARANLESLVLRAPLSGQLTALDAHVGESKAPGQRVGQIDRADTYKVEALVDEFYLSRVAAGQNASVAIDGNERDLRIAKVYPQVTDRRFKVDLSFVEAQPAGIRRGQTLELQIEIGASNKSLIVANGPFYEDTGGQWAFVLSSSGGQAERRPVTLGRRNPDTVEVVTGLSKGEQVVTSDYETFKTFDRIQLRGR